MLRRFCRREAGQAMVEFAIVLPILLLILCGIIDFGWIFYNQLTLNNAAREGARYAAVHYDPSPASTWKSDAEARMHDSMSELEARAAADMQPSASISDPEQQQITATVTMRVKCLTGFTSTVLQTIWRDDTLTLHARCTMRQEN